MTSHYFLSRSAMKMPLWDREKGHFKGKCAFTMPILVVNLNAYRLKICDKLPPLYPIL